MGTASTSEGTRLTLTWDTKTDDLRNDSLILAGIRTIAIWIREDDNENLRNETAGLMDMFIELYKESSTEFPDFRYPVLLALEGIMVIEEGIETFLAQNGWQIISDDLRSIIKHISGGTDPQDNSIVAEANRGLQIVRILLAILDHERTSFPEESWMSIIKDTSGMKVTSTAHSTTAVELQIAMLQLCTALMTKASGGMTKRYMTSHAALSGIMSQLISAIHTMNDRTEAAEFLVLLEDVSMDLENLR